MSPPLARRARATGLVPILLVASCAVIAVQFAAPGHTAGGRSHSSSLVAATVHRDSNELRTSTSTAPTVPPTTSTTSTTVAPPPPAPPPTTTTTLPPPPARAPAATASAEVPPNGQASVWGCAAALSYLSAHAHPGFTFACPGNAEGRQGMTCVNVPGVCPNEQIIAIADPCPAAYMNEASNSWVLLGDSTAPIDPYGTCP